MNISKEMIRTVVRIASFSWGGFHDEHIGGSVNYFSPPPAGEELTGIDPATSTSIPPLVNFAYRR